MPQNEDIEAICLGQGWAAAATSALFLRLFSIGGVQKEIFSLPGPVVSMAGHGEQLFIVYHRGRFFFQSFIILPLPKINGNHLSFFLLLFVLFVLYYIPPFAFILVIEELY